MRAFNPRGSTSHLAGRNGLGMVMAIPLHLLLLSACQDAPATESGAPPAAEPSDPAPQNLPLKEIMGGLEQDLADVAHGLWIEDPSIVSGAATRIANHPTVLPEQMVAIQEALGSEFPAFVQMDRAVHDAAVDLAAAADSSSATTELFARYRGIQEGCMACHVTFREGVAEALGAAGRSPR